EQHLAALLQVRFPTLGCVDQGGSVEVTVVMNDEVFDGAHFGLAKLKEVEEPLFLRGRKRGTRARQRTRGAKKEPFLARVKRGPLFSDGNQTLRLPSRSHAGFP